MASASQSRGAVSTPEQATEVLVLEDPLGIKALSQRVEAPRPGKDLENFTRS
jgi:hypothetical protein